MPADPVPRVLEYVQALFLLCAASTFPWWAAAQLSGTAYRRIWSAIACSMRVFSYSIALLALLVAAQSLHLGPHDPRSTVLSWIHVGGTLAIAVPSAARSFRIRGGRLALVVAAALALQAGLMAAAAALSPALAEIFSRMPRYLSRAP